MSIMKCKILSIKRAKIRKNDKKSLVFREIYSKFIIWGNYKNFHHALVALQGNQKVLGQNICPCLRILLYAEVYFIMFIML